MLVVVGVGRALVNTANFGRDYEAVARLGAQYMAQAQLALSVTIPGRGIEVADPRRMRCLDGGRRLCLGQVPKHVAEARPAHAELRGHEWRFADPASQERIHVNAYPSARMNHAPCLSPSTRHCLRQGSEGRLCCR